MRGFFIKINLVCVCIFNAITYICTPIVAGMVKLVDTPDLGSGAARCEGSSPFTRTKSSNESWSFFILK